MIIKFQFVDKDAMVTVKTAVFGMVMLELSTITTEPGLYIGAVIPKISDNINDMTWFNLLSWSSLDKLKAESNGAETDWVEIEKIYIIPDQGKEYEFSNFEAFKTVEITSFGKPIKITGLEYEQMAKRIRDEQIVERFKNAVNCINQTNIANYLIEETDNLAETFDRMLAANVTGEDEVNAIERILVTFASGYGRYDATLKDGSICGLILCKKQADHIIDYIGRRFMGETSPDEDKEYTDICGEIIRLSDIYALTYVRKVELDYL